MISYGITILLTSSVVFCASYCDAFVAAFELTDFEITFNNLYDQYYKFKLKISEFFRTRLHIDFEINISFSMDKVIVYELLLTVTNL